MRRRIILQNSGKINYEYVDLGLPSGILWATANIGAEKEEDYGLYFQWGDTSGYTADQVGSGAGQKYFGWADYKYNGSSSPGSVSITKYYSTDGKTVLEPSDDAATSNMGEGWRMPTMDELVELYSGCTNTIVKINGIEGRKLISKKYTNKYIFLPAAGFALSGNTMQNLSSVWSSSLETSYTYAAKTLNFLGASLFGSLLRCHGISVRGVKFNQNSDLVDLGLPSGTLWAKCNIGASTETEYGNYYQYGKGASPYQVTSGQSDYAGMENPLKSSYDTATQVLGEPYHTPTSGQCAELTANTTYEYTSINGVNGGKFTSTADTTQYIFIPAAGNYTGGTSMNLVGTHGFIRLSTPSSASQAYNMNIYNNSTVIHHVNARKSAFSVRPVVG